MSNLFRKKSLEGLDSPESLDEFLKVTNVPSWIVLIAILLIIIGFIAWACLATVDGISPIEYMYNK